MKKTILSAVLVFTLVLTGFSQKSISIGLHGGFGGPFINTTFLDEPSFSIGGGGAALITKNIFFGGFGQETSLINPVNSTLSGFENYRIESEFGGLWLGYIIRTKHLDFTISGKSAWGEISLINPNIQVTEYDNISVLIPSFEIEKRLGSITKISLGVFYNFYNGVKLESYTNKDFSAPGVSLSFKFGVF